MTEHEYKVGGKVRRNTYGSHDATFGEIAELVRQDSVGWYVRRRDGTEVYWATGNFEPLTPPVSIQEGDRVKVLDEYEGTVTEAENEHGIVRVLIDGDGYPTAFGPHKLDLLSKVEPESETSTIAMSRAGMSNADICRKLGWTEGTQIVGDEGYGPTVWEITALRPTGNLLAKQISHNGKPVRDTEHFCTLSCRDWTLFAASPLEHVEDGNNDDERQWLIRSILKTEINGFLAQAGDFAIESDCEQFVQATAQLLDEVLDNGLEPIKEEPLWDSPDDGHECARDVQDFDGEDDDGRWCIACHEGWPCSTNRRLTVSAPEEPEGEDKQVSTNPSDHYGDNPSDHGDFNTPERCIECKELWPCPTVRAEEPEGEEPGNIDIIPMQSWDAAERNPVDQQLDKTLREKLKAWCVLLEDAELDEGMRVIREHFDSKREVIRRRLMFKDCPHESDHATTECIEVILFGDNQ